MRVAILASEAGQGHTAAAQNLKQTAPPHLEVKIFQLGDYLKPIHKRIFISNYFWLSTFANGLFWRLSYHLSNSKFGYQFHLLSHNFLFSKSKQALSAAIRAYQPDIIISTIFLGPYFLESDLTKLPHYSVITDYGLHCAWYHPTITTYFVGNTQVAQALKKIDSTTQSVVTGIPVSPSLYLAPKLAGQSASPHLLLILNGPHSKKAVDYAQALLYSKHQWSATIICGKNDSLKQKLDQINQTNNNLVRIIGWTDTIGEYIQAAAIVITKPGGLTTSECLALGKPMILINPIPGQEEANTNFLLSENRAILVKKPSDLVVSLEKSLQDLNKKNRTIFPIRPATQRIWESILSAL